MIIDFDESEETITINGKKFTVNFFEDLLDPDESWLYRFKRIGKEIIVERVIQMCDDTTSSLNMIH